MRTNILAKLVMTLTIGAIASILIIGGLIASPDAYSTNDNDVLDECSCEKPDTLKVQFNAPVDGEFKIEIYKKLDDRNDPKKLPLITFEDVPKVHVEGEPLVISAILFGKDKLESNTAFVVYEVDGAADPDNPGEFVDKLVALMEIHTSCSKPLYKGLEVNNNGYSLLVEDGLIGGSTGTTSIPLFEPLSCEDKKPKKMGSITIRKALTNDNGGTAKFEDFTIKVTNVETIEDFELVRDMTDPSISVKDVPVGTYKITETGPDGYTTVMIAGDTNCPSMVDEVFTIKKGKQLSCTIYNDDNGDGDNGEIEPGVIFHVGTVKFDNNGGTSVPRCDDEALDLPCVFEDDMGLFSIVPKLKPNENLHETTLVLMSVVGLFADNTNDPDSSTGCTFDGLTSFTEIIDGGDNIIHSSFKIQCSSLSSDDGIFRINYALIETA